MIQGKAGEWTTPTSIGKGHWDGDSPQPNHPDWSATLLPPTETEINPYSDYLDGAYAVKHFLGKTLQEAELLFCDHESNLTYFEDLMHMGPKAFCYYVAAAFSPFRMKTDYGHPLRYLIGIIKLRIDECGQNVKPCYPVLLDGLRYIIDRWDEFDEDDKMTRSGKEDLYQMYVGLLGELSNG